MEKKTPWYLWIIYILFWPISLSVWIWRKPTWSKRKKAALLALVWVVFFVVAAAQNTDQPVTEVTQPQPTAEEIQAQEPVTTPVVEVASATPEPDLNPEAEQYVIEMLTIGADVQESMEILGQLSEKPLDVFYDNEFRFEIAAAMAVIKSSYDKSLQLNPPEEFVTANNEFVAGLALYDQAMDKLAIGIDDRDVDEINEATAMIVQGNTHINKATELISN